MDIKKQAKEYALEAHSGQRRKSDLAKPMVIHPINVADILSSYGFDDNVVAAGYLHDVVEDTKKTLDDIRLNFGDDIASLVDGASEPDKSLSWEERKQHTIDVVKTLDFRHKAVIAADKISNLEDLRILFGIKGEYDYSAFKRGYDSQKWYNEEVYKSITNGEIKHPMFDRLKTLIDYMYGGIEDPFLKDLDSDEKKNYFRLLEIIKLNTFVNEYVYKAFVNDSELIDYINEFIKSDINIEIVSNLEDNIDVIIDSNNDSSLKEYASSINIPYINTNNRNEALTFILNSIKEKLLIKINDVKELRLKK